MTIGQNVDEPIEPAGVEIAHRIPVANNTVDTNLIVQLIRRRKRNAVPEKSRQAKLNSTDLGVLSAGPVYSNEHPCPEIK